MEVSQLALPSLYRQTVPQLAHQIPLAGHMGKNKTAACIHQCFYWLTLIKDVNDYCQSCMECQKCSMRPRPRAPMVPLRTVEESFQRIAMDVVGPLPHSRSSNKFILVVCDYTT